MDLIKGVQDGGTSNWEPSGLPTGNSLEGPVMFWANKDWEPLDADGRKKAQEYGCQPKNRVVNPPKWMVKIMENPIKMDDLGVPLFLEAPIFSLQKVAFHGDESHNSPWKREPH